MYKGDNQMLDLQVQIPKTHGLMTIRTAKHIEVAYTWVSRFERKDPLSSIVHLICLSLLPFFQQSTSPRRFSQESNHHWSSSSHNLQLQSISIERSSLSNRLRRRFVGYWCAIYSSRFPSIWLDFRRSKTKNVYQKKCKLYWIVFEWTSTRDENRFWAFNSSR